MVDFSPGQVAGLRVFISFLVILPLSVRHLKILNKKNIRSFLITGFVGIAFPAFLYTLAQTKIESGVAGVLNSLTPVFTLLVGIIVYRSFARYYNIIGVFIGFIGAFLLISGGEKGTFTSVDWHALLILLATICYGFNVNEIKHFLSGYSGIQIASISFLLIGPPAGIFLLCTDLTHALSSDTGWLSFFHVATLAIFGSVIAMIIFNNLIRYTTTLFASSVTYIIPIFALTWGVFDGEMILYYDIIGMIVILFGVFLVNKK